jgi:hypothetical protein
VLRELLLSIPDSEEALCIQDLEDLEMQSLSEDSEAVVDLEPVEAVVDLEPVEAVVDLVDLEAMVMVASEEEILQALEEVEDSEDSENLAPREQSCLFPTASPMTRRTLPSVWPVSTGTIFLKVPVCRCQSSVAAMTLILVLARAVSTGSS